MAQQWVGPYSFSLNSIFNHDVLFAAGEDYFPVETEVIFSPSESIKTAAVPLINDNIQESREWFLVELVLPVDQVANGVLLEAPVMSNVTIEDDDSKYGYMTVRH